MASRLANAASSALSSPVPRAGVSWLSGALFQLAPDLANPAHQRGFLGKAFLSMRPVWRPLAPAFSRISTSRSAWSAPAADSRESTRSCVSKSVDLPRGVLDGRRRSVLPQGQARASRIQHADGFIGQLPPRQKTGGRAAPPPRRLRPECGPCVLLERGGDAPQHGHALGFLGSSTFHHLEAPRQRRVFLEILLILGPRGGGDGSQFRRAPAPVSTGWPRHPGRLASRADHGVGFVDEQDDGSGRRFHFLDEPLQPVFEFALDARPGLQQR